MGLPSCESVGITLQTLRLVQCWLPEFITIHWQLQVLSQVAGKPVLFLPPLLPSPAGLPGLPCRGPRVTEQVQTSPPHIPVSERGTGRSQCMHSCMPKNPVQPLPGHALSGNQAFSYAPAPALGETAPWPA